ncbi:tripartite tricarboxylate transporter TctB family protein [Antarctobacter jejuensis]|uniref:tripartite tricarboxylate transporter TctB family protein n=1 Tax=Antarctobacter jejuensis TaxID=1439938 RepID=UPI003FD69958
MNINRDVVTGAALIALAIAMAWNASGFPQIPVMAYGPDLFPNIIATGLVLSGLGILLEARRGTAPEQEDTRPTAWIPFVTLIGIVAAFTIILPWLGFHVSAALAFVVAVRLFGGSWPITIGLSVVAPFALHYVFYSILRVALPWGVLTPLAW